MKYKAAAVLALIILAGSFTLRAKELEDYLPDDVSYNPGIPKPSEVLGFEIGEQHPDHALIVQYMYKVAEASDRFEIKEYARTYQHRPLLLLTATSPENLGNIDEIRENHLRLSDPGQSEGVNIDDMPVVTWLGYSVHGNEPSGASVSMLLVYYLAAAEGEKIDLLLDESVILIDPVYNPDGLNRFSSWVNSHRSAVMDGNSDHREHNEVWPGSRTNHYWFDLNRDWMPVVHPESRGRIDMYQKWKPNVLTDHHEMGTQATYFFQPGVPSRDNPLIPDRTIELTADLAEYHAAFLDEFNQLYWTREGFDDYYIGKGSTYPDLQGTIGILFEQASARGHLHDSRHGKVSFPFAIRNQFATSLSTMEGTHEMRTEFLEHMRDFYLDAMENARDDDIKAYVFGNEKDQGRTYHLLDILDHHNIDVYELAEEIERGGVTYDPSWAYIVPTEQPQYTYLKGLFMEHHEFTDSLFYDVSTWTLPHTFNLDYAELREGGRFSRDFDEDFLGDRVGEPPFPEGRLHGEKEPYAYLFEWHEFYAPRAAFRLLDAGVRIKTASRTFTAETESGSVDFDYGTMMVNSGIQDEASPEEIHEIMETIAREDGIEVHTVETGLTPEGIDLGSGSFNSVEKPSTMIIAGRGTSMYESGQVWHLLDQRYRMNHTLVDKNDLSGADLDRYNNIVMVSGNYDDLSDDEVADLKEWVRDGGTLTAIGSGVRWPVENDLVDVSFRETHRRSAEKGDFPKYTDETADRGSEVIGGTIFETRVDLTHPLLYGYTREKLPVFRDNRIMIEPTENPYASPVRYVSSAPRLSGYVSDKNHELLEGIAGLVVGSHGSGRVILMPDNPNFRAFWLGTNKLFANALFFGNTISAASTE